MYYNIFILILRLIIHLLFWIIYPLLEFNCILKIIFVLLYLYLFKNEAFHIIFLRVFSMITCKMCI